MCMFQLPVSTGNTSKQDRKKLHVLIDFLDLFNLLCKTNHTGITSHIPGDPLEQLVPRWPFSVVLVLWLDFSAKGLWVSQWGIGMLTPVAVSKTLSVFVMCSDSQKFCSIADAQFYL